MISLKVKHLNLSQERAGWSIYQEDKTRNASIYLMRVFMEINKKLKILTKQSNSPKELSLTPILLLLFKDNSAIDLEKRWSLIKKIETLSDSTKTKWLKRQRKNKMKKIASLKLSRKEFKQLLKEWKERKKSQSIWSKKRCWNSDNGTMIIWSKSTKWNIFKDRRS